MGVLLMSNFTTQVRYLCESFGGEAHGVREIDNQIKRANRTIFDFDYPIFDKNYKEELELKIIRHYYMREIGAETFGLWQLYLCDKMNEIMPYYNQLYTSTLLKLEPLINISTSNVETENENYKGNEVTGNVKGTSVNENVSSDLTDNWGARQDSYREGQHTSDSTNTSSSQNSSGSITTPGVTTTVRNTGSSEDSNNTSATDTQTQPSTSTSKSTSWNINSDTPQGGLNNITKGTAAVSDANLGAPHGDTQYASSIDESTNTSKSESTAGTSVTTSSSSGSTQNDSTSTTSVTGHDDVQSNDSSSSNSYSAVKDGTTANGYEQKSGSDNHAGNTSRYYVDKTNDDTTHDSNSSRDKSLYNAVKGLSGVSQSKLLQEWRETFLNIDKQIIEDLGVLFFGLYE